MKKISLLLFLLSLSFFPLSACEEDTQNDNVLTLISAVTGEEYSFVVELAVMPEEQARGLMHRTEMDKNAGMLFYFADTAERAFWMKNTLIPLDMIFIRADGTIANIHENAIPHDLTSIRSKEPVVAVLEINGGLSQEYGIKAGDRVVGLYFSQIQM